MKELLFSYGTLQLEKVQIETFGRKLKGTEEILPGYKLENLQIVDKEVLNKSEQEFHPIAVPSENKSSEVKGMLFDISTEELLESDKYEVSDYKRIEATFKSGMKGWVYVKND